MRESSVEAYLVRRVKAFGGRSYKWRSVNHRGVADRIVVLPYSLRDEKIVFVETKAPRRDRSPLQVVFAQDLAKLGVHVELLDTYERVDAFMRKHLG